MAILFVMTSSVAIPDPCDADFELTPSLAIREEYNDNIFLSDTATVSDFITRITPAVSILYDAKLLTLDLEYGLDFKFYADNSDLNETSLTDVQHTDLQTTIDLYRNVMFVEIYDEYKRVVLDDRGPVALDNIFVNLSNSNQLRVKPYVKYPLRELLTVSLAYEYENFWFQEEEGDDTEIHGSSLTISREVAPATFVTASSYYRRHLPEQLEEYNQWGASVNIESNPSRPVFYSARLGHAWIDFEESRSTDTTVLEAQLGYRMTKRALVTTSYMQDYLESFTTGPYRLERALGSIAYEGQLTVTMDVFGETRAFELSRRKDRLAGTTLEWDVPLGHYLTFSMLGSYTHLEFFPEDEDTDRYSAQGALEGKLRVGAITFAYTYNQNDAETAANNYESNIFWISFRIPA